jgi:hypothetical protein
MSHQCPTSICVLNIKGNSTFQKCGGIYNPYILEGERLNSGNNIIGLHSLKSMQLDVLFCSIFWQETLQKDT